MQRKKYLSTPRVRKYRREHRGKYNYSNRKSDAKWFIRHAKLGDLEEMDHLVHEYEAKAKKA